MDPVVGFSIHKDWVEGCLLRIQRGHIGSVRGICFHTSEAIWGLGLGPVVLGVGSLGLQLTC